MELIRALFLASRGEVIDIRPFNPFALVILLGLLALLRRRGKSVGYLLCFSLFFLYLWAVCSFTTCPLPIGSDLVDHLRTIDRWQERINLVPTFFNDNFYLDEANVAGNFLLGVPFGLGLPFVVAAKNRVTWRAVAAGLGLAAGLELVQLWIGAIFYGFPYRSIDIDDVLLVFAGTLFGYLCFRLGAALYRRLGWERGGRLPVWNHLHDVLLHVGSHRGSPAVPASREDLRNQMLEGPR